MFMNTFSAIALSACLASLSSASPIIARHDDRRRPITWISPDHEEFCWQALKGRHEFASGDCLGLAACDNSPSQQFLYTTGPTTIQLSNTDLCVEFGPGLGKNGTPLRLDKCCEKGAPGQRLFITADNHIALEGARGQCADVKDGAVVDGMGKLQTWRCSADNINQIFFGKLPKVVFNTVRPSSNTSLCLRAYQPPVLEEIALSFEPCDSLELAAKRFLFPAINNTVQYFWETTGHLRTWSQEFVEYPGFTGYLEVFLEDPPLDDVISVTPGQGQFEDWVRFSNEKSGLCVTFVSLTAEAGVPDFVTCDDSDANQFFYIELIREHK
ncbi:hypothetical protein NCC49_001957 [Naganishia albida]|nr:hypothetical protein NCC49_001957 [Naganishia albida]